MIKLQIVSGLGMIKKRRDKHINKIPDNPSLYDMQNIAFCRPAYLLKESAINVIKI